MAKHSSRAWLAILTLLLPVAVLAQDQKGDPSAAASPEAVLPKGWTLQARRVKVLTPKGEQEKDITYYRNSIGMEFVLVPAGEFMMGSGESPDDVVAKSDDMIGESGRLTRQRSEIIREGVGQELPQHRVRITKPFFLGACEVTQGQYEAMMGKNPSHFKGPNNPVETVSWNDAQEFCKQLTQKDGANHLLPTEAQWEYACRAGTTTPFYMGETISTEQANYDGYWCYGAGKKGAGRGATTPVGTFSANPWGLYDMHGNVWEWCHDWLGEDYYAKSPAADPAGPGTGVCRVLRGGAWSFPPRFSRSSYRSSLAPKAAYFMVGFRVVVVWEPEGAGQEQRGSK